MANSASSQKRARQAVKRNKHNAPISASVRTFIKKVANAIEGNDKKKATNDFAIMQKNLDKAVNKKLIHKNQAARKKSRLNAKINRLN